MQNPYKNILVIQTAFIGDVVLTLPLVQLCKKVFKTAAIDFVAIPRTTEILKNHPDIRKVIVYDKRGVDKGIRGNLKLARRIKAEQYDLALIPHRSLRSAMVAWFGQVPERIGFDTSAGAFLFSKTVKYECALHEIERNMNLLVPLGIRWNGKELPNLYPSSEDKHIVDQLLSTWNINRIDNCVAIAPGSVWKTKQWLEERFIELCQSLIQKSFKAILVGGEEDVNLCGGIQRKVNSSELYNASGRLSVLQSAELIRRCRVLVSNDSAPMHLAVAMRTPVVAIFGATVPAFGFYPYGEQDIVVETEGLSCRPCSVHGGEKCPIRTFDCMANITSQQVCEKVVELAGG